MTNFEKYKDEIMEMSLKGSQFCNEFIAPNILYPKGYNCRDVLCTTCNVFCAAWLMDEYKESEVDWDKVPVNTQIYVKVYEVDKWIPRHFAKFENGKVYAWFGGATSWTCDEDEVMPWRYAKLAEVEE